MKREYDITDQDLLQYASTQTTRVSDEELSKGVTEDVAVETFFISHFPHLAEPYIRAFNELKINRQRFEEDGSLIYLSNESQEWKKAA